MVIDTGHQSLVLGLSGALVPGLLLLVFTCSYFSDNPCNWRLTRPHDNPQYCYDIKFLPHLRSCFSKSLFFQSSLFLEANAGKRTWDLELHTPGNGTPLQYSCLENPMDGGAWWAAVRGVAKSQIRLSDLAFPFMHGRRRWQPTPVFLPGESQGQGSLVGCRLWGRTESDTTEAT